MAQAEKGAFHVDKARIGAAFASPDADRNLESLRNIDKLGDFFEKVTDVAVDICLKNPSLLSPGINFEKAEKVIRNVDWTGISPLDEEYEPLLDAAMIKEAIGRELIRKVIEGPNKLNLTTTESVVLKGSSDMGAHFDRLYWEWRQNVVTSPLAQRLAAMGADSAKELLRSHHVLPEENKMDEYLYVVFTEPEAGIIESKTYAEAFPEAIRQASKAMDDTVDQLKRISDNDESKERDALITYFTAFRRALESTNPDKQEALYRAVDEAWLAIHGRMQPIHMMESYDDSLGLRVEPEFNLVFKDDRYGNVNDVAEVAKRGLVDYLSKAYNGYVSLDASVPTMMASLAGVFTSGVISGVRQKFLPAGQNIPNREQVRLKDGVKIFMDMKTLWQRWNTEKGYLIKLLGQPAVDSMFADEEAIISNIAGFFVGGHEVGHNAFVQDGTRSGVGSANYKSIEEDKADHVIVASAPEFLTQSELSVFLKGYLASLMRDLTLRDDPAKRPYYNGGLVSLNAMHEVGMLQNVSDGSWRFDLSSDKIQAFFEESRNIFSQLVDAYEAKSAEKAEAYISRNYIETPFIQELLKKIELV